jgi:hypothetical protein
VAQLMRTSWDGINQDLAGPWRCLVVRVNLSADCALNGPVIWATTTPDACLRVEEVLLGPASTTQARRLLIKVINKAVDTAYAEVFKVRRNPDGRISHVAWVKIPSKLCDMFHNLFAWYGY